MAVFPRGLGSVPPAAGNASLRVRRTGRVAALTVADVVDRWWNNYSGVGFGLRGGHWSYGGDRITRFHLHRVKLVSGVAVSGTATWDRYGNAMRVRLRLAGSGAARPAARELAHASYGRERRARREAGRSSGSSHVPRALTQAPR